MGTPSRLVATVLATLVTAGCTDDVLDASYASRSEVEADGAIARGWVPEWLPAEATHIREVHNVHSSESALAFRLPRGAGWRPPSPCQPATRSKPRAPRFNREWIPKLDGRAKYYSCPVEEGSDAAKVETVAILSGGQQVLHWRALAR